METVRLFSMSVCPPSVQGDPRLTFGSGSSLGTRDNREGDRAYSTGPPAFQSQQGVLLLRPPPRRVQESTVLDIFMDMVALE